MPKDRRKLVWQDKGVRTAAKRSPLRICLTDLQKEIYEYVVALGSATVEKIAEKFNVHQTNLENQLATLKHCQLLKGKREGDMAYIVPW